MIGCGLLTGMAIACWFGPMIRPYGTSEFVAEPLEPPSWDHPLGTDTFGRDLLVRLLVGGRLDLIAVVLAVAVPFCLGTLLGAAVGLSGRRSLDSVLMRVVDAVVAFPFVILLLVLVLLLGPDRTFLGLPAGMPSVFVAIYLIGWAVYARLARAETLSLREREYVIAARLLGYSSARILRRHILRTVFGTTGTYAVGDAVLVIAVLAALPFLGAGVAPPTPEWGSIMAEGRPVLPTAWWVSVMPGVMIVVTGIGLSLVADALVRGREG